MINIEKTSVNTKDIIEKFKAISKELEVLDKEIIDNEYSWEISSQLFNAHGSIKAIIKILQTIK